jgi:hypothetical protein
VQTLHQEGNAFEMTDGYKVTVDQNEANKLGQAFADMIMRSKDQQRLFILLVTLFHILDSYEVRL